MYALLMVVLVGVSAWLIATGARRSVRVRTLLGVGLLTAAVALFGLARLWTEVLWFQSLGFEGRFWTELIARSGLAAGGGIIGASTLWLLSRLIPRTTRKGSPVGTAMALAAVMGAVWGLSSWDTFLKFVYSVPAGIEDPILGMDAGFYLFALPLYDSIYWLVLLFSIVFVGLAILGTLASLGGLDTPTAELKRPEGVTAIYAGASLLLIVIGAGLYLDRYHLLFSSWGTVAGVGWTDEHIRLPTYFVIAGICVVIALAFLVSPARKRVERILAPSSERRLLAPIRVLGAGAGAVVASWILGLSMIPGLFQWLRVEPNEITVERPYIENNICLTRHAFGLADVEEREFPFRDQLSRQTVKENQALFDNIRLWDWRALVEVYEQFQEIRPYYEFVDVDLDRYRIDERYRQVMISTREMYQENLPADSRTFVNRRFKYTHGYGITMNPVNEFTEGGLPDLLVKNLPPESTTPSLEVEQPRIYYGELTRPYVVVNTDEPEFDYPQGDQNVYVRYDGSGGVPLDSFWRRFIYGWRFGGTRLLLSSYPNDDSRILFRRTISERVRALAPFLRLDNDPYVVLVDGRLKWIADAYTTSRYFPYSKPYSARELDGYRLHTGRGARRSATTVHLDGVNYIRNSVKAVVDAYDGTVELYIFQDDDPVARTWARIFPGLFKRREEMPQSLLAHVRYPQDLLLVQGLVYAKYHMTDPAVFYNQEDLWIRATEKYYQDVGPVEPYYILWNPPDTDSTEFVLMLPFTPKNRQVMISWIAGMCDLDNYGRLLAFKFPKDKRVLGPQQVETKIDQDSQLSGQLTLWDQRGSNVIRGNVLAIPVDQTLLYVEPIYLQAETAAYPELRLVCIMHGDTLSYGRSFDEALEGLLGGETRSPTSEVATGSLKGTIHEATAAFDDYLDAMADRRFEVAGGALKRLENALDGLAEEDLASRTGAAAQKTDGSGGQ